MRQDERLKVDMSLADSDDLKVIAARHRALAESLHTTCAERDRAQWLAGALSTLIIAISVKVDAPDFPPSSASQDDVMKWITDVAERLGKALSGRA